MGKITELSWLGSGQLRQQQQQHELNMAHHQEQL